MGIVSKKLLDLFIKANSESEIDTILIENGFYGTDCWRLYGDRELNQNIIDNQQADPVAALVEKPINSIDAILLLECKKRGIDPEGSDAPQSMREALKDFFGVDLDKLFDLSSEERRNLAQNIFIVTEGSKPEPNVIIADRGEGQNPDDFPKTFMSLEGKVKNTIPFVQGQYSMGGTGILRFCGKKRYELILSRKNQSLLKSGQKDEWGFTLVRKHFTEGTKYKTEWYEYLVDENRGILRFPAENLDLISEEPAFVFGTYIKLYNYRLGNLSSIATLDLWRAINRRLFMPTIPLMIFEGRSEYRGKSPKKIMLGNRQRIFVDEWNSVEDQFSIPVDLGPFGMRKLWIVVFKQNVKSGEFTTYKDAVFLTINGQTLGTWDRSLFGPEGARLHYIKNHLLVHIDLTDVDTHIRTSLFMPSRDRIAEGDEFAEQLKDRLVYELKNCERLKKLNEMRREERISTTNRNEETLFKDIFQKLLDRNRSLAEMLPFGKKIKIKSQNGHVGVTIPFRGQYIPSFLKVFKARGEDKIKKILPINSYIQVKLETDAQNDYLDRETDGGKLLISSSVKVLSGGYLNDGIIPFRISPQKTARVGEIDEVAVELTRPYETSLYTKFIVEYSSPIKKVTKPRGEIKKKEESFDIPLPKPILKEGWNQFTPKWTGEDIVEIGEIEKDGQKIFDVWINMDADVLNNYLRSKTNLNEGKQNIIRTLYKAGIHLHSLVLYHEFEDRVDKSELVAKIMRGVSKVILLLGDEGVLKYIEE